MSIDIARCDLVGGHLRIVEAAAIPGISVPARIDGRAAHRLRDLVELAVGAPIDEVVLFGTSVADSLAGLLRVVRQADDAVRRLELRAAMASTMAPLPLAALVVRLATLPEAAIERVSLDANAPFGAAVVAALQLPPPSSMRDRLRSVTWA
jgi:hypothetical protein